MACSWHPSNHMDSQRESSKVRVLQQRQQKQKNTSKPYSPGFRERAVRLFLGYRAPVPEPHSPAAAASTRHADQPVSHSAHRRHALGSASASTSTARCPDPPRSPFASGHWSVQAAQVHAGISAAACFRFLYHTPWFLSRCFQHLPGKSPSGPRGGTAPPAAWYRFSGDRKGQHPKDHFSGYRSWMAFIGGLSFRRENSPSDGFLIRLKP